MAARVLFAITKVDVRVANDHTSPLHCHSLYTVSLCDAMESIGRTGMGETEPIRRSGKLRLRS